MSPSDRTAIVGRTRELGSLRRAFDQPEASVIRVAGLPGVGKTRLVRQAASDFRALYHRAPPLPDPQQRAALARTLRQELLDAVGEPTASDLPSWQELFGALVASTSEGRPLVLVVDDAHRWEESRARYGTPLQEALIRARAVSRPVHLVLIAPELPAAPTSGEPAGLELTVHPLPFRAASALLPGETVRDRLRAYAVFGGLPRHLVLVDPAASLGTNARRLLLTRDGALSDAPLALLERLFQTPARYAAVLAALAPGEADWGTVHAGVPDLSASGQAAPYLKRLEEVGLVEARRSLDASPRTRARRYRLRDPFLAFWFRFVLPHRHRFADASADALYAEVVRPQLDRHVASVFPQVCRDFMANDAVEVLGANARECGSLWGRGYDIPVAGVLGTGSPFYGLPVTDEEDSGGSLLPRLDAEIRETRYGFGREQRLRLLFLIREPTSALLRDAARRHDTVVVGPDAL
ncbi:MAG: AAA family ATPase [Longimicrobiales bacterium]|nr:AAA family ATPase [Longimicrobiales bacterium]